MEEKTDEQVEVEVEKEVEVEVDDQTVAFFTSLVNALVASVATKSTKNGDMVLPPEATRPYDAVFSVLTQEDRNEQAKETLENEQEFRKLRNGFVKGLKKGIQEDKK